MGFYGNISNTSKATFQFDRTYANKRDMDNGASLGDGVYPGRFVLVDYNESIQDGFYELDSMLGSQDEIYWMYNGKLYMGSPTMKEIVVDKEKDLKEQFYLYPEADLLVTSKTVEFAAGKLVKIPVGRRAGNLNTQSLYFKVTNVSSSGKYEVSFDANMTTYNNWLTEHITNTIKNDESLSHLNQVQLEAKIDQAISESYRPVKLSNIYYEPNTFFVMEDSEFVLDKSGVFDENTIYYERTEHQDFDVFITSSTRNTDGWKYGEDVITSTHPLEVGHYYRVPMYHRYSLNYQVEYWQIQSVSEGGEYTWKAVIDDETASDNYFKNMSIDRAYVSEFGDSTGIASRGFDSTVWQKVVQNGRDKYVMVAELNSVVPTFDIAFDPPTAIPMVPHFDKDSTNVYYKLHTQPQWGFRTKASNPIQGPMINAAGGFGGLTDLSADTIIYPSDQVTRWKSDFYNTYTGDSAVKYFNPKQSTWTSTETEDNDINAAIYYNKAGFLPEKIVYSGDLLDEKQKEFYNAAIAKSGWKNEDKIAIQPTGLSGQEYNPHDNGQATAPAADTQELSIMLPSLGDTMSQIWDMIFGGRTTNKMIELTNRRNMDYKWEDGKGVIDRIGLRLVDYKNDNPYNTAQIETLAGCINSAHDLMGMIITGDTAQSLAGNLQNLHKDRIYYIQPSILSEADKADEDIMAVAEMQSQYVMKHKTYDYTPVTLQTDYVVEDTVIPDVDITNYYVYENGAYRKAKVGDTGPFYKLVYVTPDEDDLYTDITSNMKVWEDKYWYQDINSSPYSKDGAGNPILSKQDYIKGDKYQKENRYYTVTNPTPVALDAAYEPGKFLYKDGNGYVIDYADSSTLGRTYYVVNETLLKEVKPTYDGIYLPGLYYYYDTETKSYIKDMSVDGDGHVHYAVKITDKEEDEIGYVKEVHYVTVHPNDVATLLVTGNTVYYRDYSNGGSWTDDSGNKFEYIEMTPNSSVDTSGKTVYAVQQVIYSPAEEQVEIDTENQLMLTPYKTDTFFFKKYDSENKFIGYIPVAISEVKPNDPEQQFYAFGMWEEGKVTNGSPYIATTDIGKTKYNWALQEQSAFYTPHIYHYVTDDGSYVLDNYVHMTHDNYVKLEDENIKAVNFGNTVFYEPDEYYTKNPITGEYELIRDLELPENIGTGTGKQPIFKADKLYVYEDKAGIYEKGSEWNMEITKVPTTVTLAKRKERWELVVLEDFARSLNTMHGLILKINQTLLSGDKLTRDDTTVQGVINKMRDLVARFDNLVPEKMMIVDEYGRVVGSTWDTNQSDSVTLTKKAVNYATGVNEDRFPEVAHDAAKINQWITMNIDGTVTNPKVRIHHNFQPVTNTTDTWDLNTNKAATAAAVGVAKDVMTLYEPYVDLTGHVVGNHKRTYVLPYGFKTIKVTNTEDTVVTAPATTIKSAGQIADTTQDILTFATTNRWIKLDNNTEDTIKIGHLLSPFVTGTQANKLYGLTSNHTVAQLDTDNTFEVPCLQFDEAGHILEARTHTVTLPDNFTDHVVTVSDVTNVDSTAGSAGTVTPETMTDTMTFAEGNRWINLTADATNDKITISHYVKNFTQTTSTLDFNDTTKGKKFTVQTIGWDRAGHIISSDEKTFTLPDNFKTLAITNTGSAGVTFGSATNGNLVADTLVDTATFDIGNRWLAFLADTTNDKVTLYHTAPDANSTSASTTQTGDETPKFGATFLIPEVKYDEAGHIFKTATHTVKIPLPKLTDDTTGNVVTGLSLVAEDGAFTLTKEDLGSLTLDTYEKKNDNSDVKATDTLAEALSKLQTQINDEENARAQAIKDLLGGEEINEAFDTIKEVADWLTGNDSGADGIIDAVATLNGDDTVEGSVKKQLKDTVEALDVEDEEVDGEYVSGVSETDGKITVTRKALPSFEDEEVEGEYIASVTETNGEISVTRKALPTISDMATAVDEENLKYEAPVFADETEETEFNDADKTIAWLFQKVAQLEARIALLESPLDPSEPQG